MARKRGYPAKKGRGQRTEDIGLVSLPAPPPRVLAKPDPMTEADFEGYSPRVAHLDEADFDAGGWPDPVGDLHRKIEEMEQASPTGPGDMSIVVPHDLRARVAEATGIKESSTVPWEVLRDRVMAPPPEGDTIADTRRIGHRLKELGVRPRVFTIRGEKYLSIPLKELTIAEGGTWTAPSTTKPPHKTNRKGKQ